MAKNQDAYISRRTFLNVSALSALSFACQSKFILPQSQRSRRLGTIYQSYQHDGPNGEKSGLLIVNLDEAIVTNFETRFNVHYLEPIADGDIAIGANKYGPNYLVFDFRKNQVLQSYQVPQTTSLMGHMSMSPDQKYLVATAVENLSKPQNRIIYLDPQTFTPKDFVDVNDFFPAPHDIRFNANSKTFVTTGGQKILIVDAAKKSIESRWAAQLVMGQVLRHFAMSPHGNLAIQANHISGFDALRWDYSQGAIICSDSRETQTSILRFPGMHKSYDHEVYDFAFGPDGAMVCATASQDRFVSFWNYATGELLKTIELPDPPVRTTLSRNGEFFVFLSTTGVYFVDSQNLRPQRMLPDLSEKYAAFTSKRRNLTFAHETLI